MLNPVPIASGLVLSVAVLCHSAALSAAAPDPLFAGQETLHISLEGPFTRINRERNREQDYAGLLRYTNREGVEVSLDAHFEVRGNWRLRRENCRNAPLWVDLRRSQVVATLFANQNRLKLVLPCGRQARYTDYLHKERQAYELFGLLSDYALGVRALQIEFLDSESGGQDSQVGFFIEHHRRLGERLGLVEEEANQVELASLDPQQRTLVALFMYLLGNTDFSLIQGPEGEECCHNSKLLRSAGGSLFPVPYDFDASGYVEASYAPEPNPRFRIRNNRQRHYRGFCVDETSFTQVVERYQGARPHIMDLIENDPDVTPRSSRRSLRYVQDFFTLLDNPQRLRREIVEACR